MLSALFVNKYGSNLNVLLLLANSSKLISGLTKQTAQNFAISLHTQEHLYSINLFLNLMVSFTTNDSLALYGQNVLYCLLQLSPR